MDEAGFETAHLVGNSLGGNVALQLAARGRARSVVALAPAGGWADGDESGARPCCSTSATCCDAGAPAAPYADAIMATAEGRRRAAEYVAERWEHIPADLLAHQLVGAAGCDAAVADDRAGRARGVAARARSGSTARSGWCGAPPTASSRGRRPPPATAATAPNADWVELDGVGHCPQLDVPLETAQLILGWTAP